MAPSDLFTAFVKKVALPGDCLLYADDGLISKLIRVKTWSDVSHCEVYTGGGRSVASRDGIGVGEYPLRVAGLQYILRPNEPFNPKAGMFWFRGVNGQGYDWLGLLKFFTLGKGSQTKMHCSEFETRWYRKAGLVPFHPTVDADLVSPGMFLTSGAFDRIWMRSPDA